MTIKDSAKVIFFYFFILIFVGAAFLKFGPDKFSWVDAFFTSTSASCVTGLIVKDTAKLSLYSQIVILVLIQIGGLGIMTLASFIMYLLGRRLSLQQQVFTAEEFNMSTPLAFKKLLIRAVLFTATIEGIGFLALKIFSFGKLNWWQSFFHSISAFCNAGFSTFSDSLVTIGKENHYVVLVIAILIILGGIGFPVLNELFERLRSNERKKITLHTKVVLWTTFWLIVLATLIFMFFDFGVKKFSDRLLNAFFQAVTPRTAGFEMYPQGAMPLWINLLTICLMFIGAAPASTAGGVKVTTFLVYMKIIQDWLSENEQVVIFNKAFSEQTIRKTTVIMFFSVLIVMLFTVLIAIVQPVFTLRQIFFEVVSAFGTVGLSTGITFHLNTLAKILITILMLFGRIGSITVALLIVSSSKRTSAIRYPTEEVLVG